MLLCIWGQFSKYKPPGAYIWRDDLTEGFLRYRFGGLIFGEAYTWRGLFSEFYGTYVAQLTDYALDIKESKKNLNTLVLVDETD